MFYGIEKLLEIMKTLRDPDKGCPWDLEQTYKTIIPHTIEEAYEVCEAIDNKDFLSLKDELGDLLFQVIFYSQLAQEDKLFDFNDVVSGICEKMLRRHPHVFGDAIVKNTQEQKALWEQQKEEERLKKSPEITILSDISKALPAMMRSLKLQSRAAKVGFDWNDPHSVLQKISEELEEVRQEIEKNPPPIDRLEDEIGDLLFVCINLARKTDIHPETALRRANDKFERRFNYIEKTLKEQGRHPQETSLQDMEILWNQAKNLEKKDQ
jgi:MazG family protein